LLLGEAHGWLEVSDISSATITLTRQIKESASIYDILAIDDTHFLFAT
jgi:hypothetical protein